MYVCVCVLHTSGLNADNLIKEKYRFKSEFFPRTFIIIIYTNIAFLSKKKKLIYQKIKNAL